MGKGADLVPILIPRIAIRRWSYWEIRRIGPQLNNNSQSDAKLLQNDIFRLQEWAATWQTKFNIKKCKIIRITRRTNNAIKSQYTTSDYVISSLSFHHYSSARKTKNSGRDLDNWPTNDSFHTPWRHTNTLVLFLTIDFHSINTQMK